MKTTSIFALGFFILFLSACKEDVPIPIEPDPCGAVPLGITEVAKQLHPEWVGSMPNYDAEWSWTRKDDTLIVRYLLGGWCTSHSTRYLKFTITDCITLVRDYRHNTDVILTDTPVVSSTFSDNELNFELQYWDEQQGIVGRNNDTEIWIEFNEDNRY